MQRIMDNLEKMNENSRKNEKVAFSGYQILIVATLTILQFVVILGFAIIAPLGDILIKSLNINTSH